MIGRLLQIFFALALSTSALAQTASLVAGEKYNFVFTDVDRNQLSTSDGHVSIITVMTRRDEEKTRATGDRVPDFYVGNPQDRFITIINFQGKILPPFRGLTTVLIRHSLDREAKRMQAEYSARKLARNPRQDIFVVADFDGSAVNRLGISGSSAEFAVFLFDGNGKLVRRWNDVPAEPELAQAMAAAHRE